MPKKSKTPKTPKASESLNLYPTQGKLLFETAEGIVTITLGAEETLEALRAILAITGTFPVRAYTAAQARATKRLMAWP